MLETAKAGGTVHFIGLLSDGNVHSHISQLLALLERCAQEDVKRVRVHVLTDGRDVGERSALGWLETLEAKLKSCSQQGRDYRIGSGRRAHVDHAGPLRRGLVDGRARLAHARARDEGRQFPSATEAVGTYARSIRGRRPASATFRSRRNGTPIGRLATARGHASIFRQRRAIRSATAFDESCFTRFDRGRHPGEVILTRA